MGSFVSDDQTLEYFLQEELNRHGYTNYEVVNCGIMGEGNVLAKMYTEKISKDDIVIWVYRFEEHLGEELHKIIDSVNEDRKVNRKKDVINVGNLGKVYPEIENPIGQTPDGCLAHCNHVVYQKLANKMFGDILNELSHENNPVALRTSIQDYFISPQIENHYKDYFYEYIMQKEPQKKTGAIVMNCNPFTKGHRYLIEQTCAQVDVLYNFHVHEI